MMEEIPPVKTVDGPGLTSLLQMDEQLVVGVVQKGQCGEPCAKLETMMAKMMQKMNGFFNAAIADVRAAVDTGVQGEETTIQSLFNISTLPAIYIYQYGVKEPKKAMMIHQ